MKKEKTFNIEHITIIAFFVLFFAVCMIFQVMQPTFLTPVSITTMLKTGSAVAIAALCLTFVIIVNHSDISFYMSSCFSGMFMAWLIKLGLHPVIAILGGILSGVFWGCITGLAA